MSIGDMTPSGKIVAAYRSGGAADWYIMYDERTGMYAHHTDPMATSGLNKKDARGMADHMWAEWFAPTVREALDATGHAGMKTHADIMIERQRAAREREKRRAEMNATINAAGLRDLAHERFGS